MLPGIFPMVVSEAYLLRKRNDRVERSAPNSPAVLQHFSVVWLYVVVRRTAEGCSIIDSSF